MTIEKNKIAKYFRLKFDSKTKKNLNDNVKIKKYEKKIGFLICLYIKNREAKKKEKKI